MSRRLLGVVLCGGRSTRMGRDKATLPHPDGGTFLSHALERLSGNCDHVCVCGRSSIAGNIEVINDPVRFQGPAIGVVAALAYARQHSFDACFVTPVDMPWLTRHDLSQLRQRWAETYALCCAVSEGDGRLQPLVAIYPVSYHECLRDLVDSKNRSLSRWFTSQQPHMVTLSAESCRNFNTPQDFADQGE